MVSIQRIIGFLIIISCVVGGFISGNFIIIFYGVVGGFILVSLSYVVEHLQDISERALGIPLSNQQIRKIKINSEEIKVTSNTLDINPKDDLYPLLRLDNEYYLRAKALIKYLSQEDRKYTFHFLNRKPLIYTCAIRYRPGINMFELDEQVFVKLSSLSQVGLIVNITEEGLLIENS